MDMIAILVTVAGLVIGVIIGVIIGKSSSKSAKEAKGLRGDLDQARDELSAYKEQVRQHFSRTSELVNNMTSSYRAVHEHLANSSQKLCDGSVVNLDLNTSELLESSNAKGNPESENVTTTSKTEAKENLAVKTQAGSEAETVDKVAVDGVAKASLKNETPQVYH